MNRLSVKVPLITSGISGIGSASALLFAEEGAEVIIVGRDAKKGQEKVTEIHEKGFVVTYFQCDVSCMEDILALKAMIDKKYGRLDILFNNAGILLTGALDELTDESWDKFYEVNMKAIMHMCKVFIEMLQKSGGVILNNASIHGLHSYIKRKRSYMYATSKAAAIQFSKYMAKNYAPDVRVNVLCSGITVTNLFTNRDFSRFTDCNLLGRMARSEEIAKVALFLVSDDSSFVTGSVIVADGGEILKY